MKFIRNGKRARSQQKNNIKNAKKRNQKHEMFLKFQTKNHPPKSRAERSPTILLEKNNESNLQKKSGNLSTFYVNNTLSHQLESISNKNAESYNTPN